MNAIDPDLAVRRAARDRQALVGVSLALAIVAAWTAAHVVPIFLIDWAATPLWVAVPFVAVETWLFVGLFIVAHDAMHGSLAPGRPAVNRGLGRLALFLYCGFAYDRLLPEHHKHHRRPGTALDPDYDPDHPDRFLPWFLRFLRHYFGVRELLTLAAMMAAYAWLFSPPLRALMAFYALPAVLSAFQLFYFGTYRPHRLEEAEFADEHRARSDGFPWLVSLLTCFHFGYHHEHHVTPTTPWWRLPAARAALGRTAGAGA